MTKVPRRVCSLGGVALVLSACALTLMGTPSGAFGLTFTPIDVPGATFTDAIGINDRGQIVGDFTDAGGTVHGSIAQ